MTQAVAFSILALTISVALGRPQLGAWRLSHVEAALGGALLALMTGVVTPAQALEALQLLAFPIITVLSLMAITVIAEQAGVLRLVAHQVGRAANGDARKLFAYLFVLGSVTGTLFTNDAAILILTPMVFGLVEAVKQKDWRLENKIPFYFAVLYVGNLVGALVISNPINIVVSSVFGIRFVDYAAWMMLPALVSMAVSFVGLRLFFRQALRNTCNVPPALKASDVDRGMLRPCVIVLALTLIGFFSETLTGIPVWLVALLGATALCATHIHRGHAASRIVAGMGWDVILFVIGIFIVVIGLRNQGVTAIIGHIIAELGGTAMPGLTAAAGFVAAICSALVNNHPTAGLMIWVVKDFAQPVLETQMLVFATLIGGDLGPKMLPIGSLAALMWFRMLRDRGVQVPYAMYVRIGIPVTLAAVLLSLLTLNVEYLVHQSLFG